MSRRLWWGALLPCCFLCATIANAEDVRFSTSDGVNVDLTDVAYFGVGKADSAKASYGDKGSDCCPSPCGCGCSSCCIPDEPWKMPQPCILQKMGFMIGGWVQQGVTFNQHNPADGFNGVIGTNDWDDRYQLNQVWLWLHRPADNGGCGWAVGGHVDLIYGTDFRFGVNHGLEDRINGADQDYGLVIPQAYFEVAYNKLSVKLGHMAAILDYEVVPAIGNPFYSHSYSYAYTVPQLVTGVLADYKLTDQLSIQAGTHRGWFMFEDLNGNWDFMGGIKWQSCDEKTSIAWATSVGPQDPGLAPDWNGIPGDQDRFVYSLVVQQQVTEKLKWVGVHNLGIEQNSPFGQDAEWYGLNQYLLYTINPCWQANMRFEILRDDDGMKVAGPGNYVPLSIAANDSNFHVGDFVALTLGLNWRPTPNWLVRPEVRWDWFDLDGPVGPAGLPFDAGDKDEQFTFAVDAVVTF
jgi:hypothetical protein